MGSILFKQGDGESRNRGVYIGSTTEEAVNKGNSRGSVLDVARALEKQGNSMKRGVDVTVPVDRSCSVMAVLEKEVEGLEEKIDCYKSTINRRNVMITRMKRKLDDKDEYMYIIQLFLPRQQHLFLPGGHTVRLIGLRYPPTLSCNQLTRIYHQLNYYPREVHYRGTTSR